MGYPRWLKGKESAYQSRRCRFNPWVRKIPWRRKWQPTPGFLPGKFHGQRSWAGYSPWGCKELDRAEQLSTHTYPGNTGRQDIHCSFLMGLVGEYSLLGLVNLAAFQQWVFLVFLCFSNGFFFCGVNSQHQPLLAYVFLLWGRYLLVLCPQRCILPYHEPGLGVHI